MEDLKLDNVKRILDEYALQFQELSKKELIKNDKIASGNLIASINTTIEVNGTVYTVYLNSLEYLKYIETGTKPHFPPVDKLLTWVVQKSLPTRELTGNKQLPTEKQLAYLIGRKISINGTKPTPVIANTQKELNDIYIEKLQQALIDDINNWLPIIDIQLRFH